MSSTLSPPHESSSRIWWPLSSRHSASSKLDKILRCPSSAEKHPPRESQKQSGVKFNSFASAIGFKSKKHPALTIQEPPISKQVDSAKTDPPRYANRPPSKSVSSTLRSSLEPRTPSDGPRDPLAFRQSLLTLSDDPFASRGISSIPGTQDPSRLSVYCNFSMPDDMPKKQVVANEDSSSCISLSSDSWPRRPVTSPSDAAYRNPSLRQTQSARRAKKQSDASLGRPGEGVRENGQDLAIDGSRLLCPSATTNRRSNPDPTAPPRPPMRARGMTDTDSRPKLIQHNHAPSHSFSPPPSPPPPSLNRKPSRPRVLVRQSSSSRVGFPPSAPPMHDLPPPPVRAEEDLVLREDSKHLSSGMSFASSISSEREVHFPQQYRNTYGTSTDNDQISDYGSLLATDRGRGSFASTRVDTTTLTLKKAASHQSLSKRGGFLDPKSTPIPSPEGLERVPRKQRSFHHQRLMPPIPSATSITDPTRRGSVSGHSSLGRKRLFSGSSHWRPSTSQGSTADDDIRSVFSLPLESDRTKTVPLSNALSLSTTSAHSSFWDEGAVDSPTSPVSSRDYTPQQIMSPAEMLRVEASLQEEQSFHNYSYGRSRDTSISVSTSDTFVNDYSPGGRSPPSSKLGTPERGGILKPGRLRGLSTRSSSTIAQELASPYLDARPHSHMTPPSSPCSSRCPDSSYQPELVSLPPPPPRHRPQLRPPSTFSTQPDRSSFVPIIPLSPPPPRRNHLLVKPPAEIAGQRQSLMRKPSFLEIDDDTEKNLGKPSSVGSFLDLNRESLDTVRSMDYYSDDD